MKIQLSHKFEEIICVENLLEAWKEFAMGKKHKCDVGEFSLRLMDNILSLHGDLFNHTYKHGGYQAFTINDPKPRDIHKAAVRDRLLHHAIYRILYPFFDKIFIADSYSCRLNKGVHKAVNRFREFVWKASKNNTRTCWALKCDIRKFFANIDQDLSIKILREYIPDENIINLLKNVIGSFTSSPASLVSHLLSISLASLSLWRSGPSGKGRCAGSIGLPLGNMTSQLFVNIYMNKFDQFVKHKLKAKCYIRYADDFVILSDNKKWLEEQIELMRDFLRQELKLELHPNKVFIKTLASGVDFLGLVNFLDYRILRTKTRRRMFKNIENKCNDWRGGLMSEESFNRSLQSYFGVLKHCQGYKIRREIETLIDGAG